MDDPAGILDWTCARQDGQIKLDGAHRQEGWTLRTNANADVLAQDSASGRIFCVHCDADGVWSLVSGID
jgi:hypothetical protein